MRTRIFKLEQIITLNKIQKSLKLVDVIRKGAPLVLMVSKNSTKITENKPREMQNSQFRKLMPQNTLFPEIRKFLKPQEEITIWRARQEATIGVTSP